MSKEPLERSQDVEPYQSILYDIPPFRIQSAEFLTVEIIPEPPYVQSKAIDELDVEVFVGNLPVFVLATQQCFSEKVLVDGSLTRRNIIRHVRKAYREIYREASRIGVRSELDSLRTLVSYSVELKRDHTGIILLPQVVSDSLD